MTATQEIGWIDNDAKLERLVAALGETAIAAVDTEFVREKTYYPQLCLIQIGTGEQVACVDCLASLDLEPLYSRAVRRRASPGCCTARGRISRSIFQRTGRMPPRLIDTQVAAAFTGYAPQVGLEGLLEARARRRARREFRAHRLEPPPVARRRRCVTRSTTSGICSRRGTSSRRSSNRLGRRDWLDGGLRAHCSPSSPSPIRRPSGRGSKACTACRSHRSVPRSRSCAGAKRRRRRATGRAAGCSPTKCCSRSRRRCRADAAALGALGSVEVHGAHQRRLCSRRSRRARTRSCKRKCAPTRRRPQPDKSDRQSPARTCAPARRRARRRARNPRDAPRLVGRRARQSPRAPAHRLARQRARSTSVARRIGCCATAGSTECLVFARWPRCFGVVLRRGAGRGCLRSFASLGEVECHRVGDRRPDGPLCVRGQRAQPEHSIEPAVPAFRSSSTLRHARYRSLLASRYFRPMAALSRA